MKKLIYSILFTSTILISFTGVSQNHWVQVGSTNWATSPRFLNEGSGNYSLVQAVGTGQGQMKIEEKSSSSLNWSILNTDATSGYNVTNSNQMSYFMYNGLRTVAYYNSDGSIHIDQWNSVSNLFEGLTSFTPTSLGTFSIAINPTTNNIYVACSNGTTNCVDVWFYDGTVWQTPVMQLAPSPGVYNYLNPKIHFNGDTLFLAGISMESPNKLVVYKEHYTNISTMTLVSISANSQNVDSYAMCGEAGQNPYFVGYSSTTNNLNVSSIINNTISEIGTAYIGNFLGGVSLDMTINNSVIEVVGTTDDGNGSGNVIPFKWDGNTLVPIVSSSVYSYVTGASAVRQTINRTSNGRTFLTFDTGLMNDSYFYATNNPPTVTNNTPNEVCANANDDFVFDNFTFEDLDGDSVMIIEISSNNSSVMPDGIINYTLTPTSSTANTNSYKIEVYPGSNGTADLIIKYTDGYDTLTTSAITITVKPQPTYTPPTSDVIVCNNISEVDLNPYTSANPYTGVWKYGYDILSNGIFYTSELNSQENPPLEFQYTDQITGCSNSNYYMLTVYEAPLVGISVNDADCGNANGLAQIITISGFLGYDISWSTGKEDSMSIYNLAPGQYFTTVVDTHQCQTTVPVNIGINGVNVTATTGNIDCNGGNNGFIHLNISGPGAPFTYLWSNGKSTLNIDNLVAGTYDVIITSSTGCQTSKTFVITQPDAISFPQEYYTNESNCGASDGTIYVDVITGGTGSSYNFSWNNGATTQNNTNIPAGIYNLVVTDSLGCTAQLNCTLSDYNTPYVEAETITQPSCNQSNGEIVLGLYSISDPIQSIVWSNSSTTPTISNLTAGHYSCVVTTISGCMAYGEFDLTTKAPMQNNICLLTVDSASTTNLVVWEKVETNVDHYNIYREGSTSGQYMLIDTVSGLNHSIFNDVVASPKTRSWRYKISAVNQCGVESQLSLPHKTVHLVISQSTGTQYNIVWDDYIGFSYSTVNLWRYTFQNGWELVSALPSNIYSYTDDIGSIAPAGIDYMIEITPQTPCSPDKAQDYNSSRSNKANSIMIPGAGTGVSNNSIDEYGKSLPIVMYPNPTSAILNIIWEGKTTEYQILDIQGKVIAQSTLNTGKSTVDLSNVLPGIYFIQINGTTNKIIVQ